MSPGPAGPRGLARASAGSLRLAGPLAGVGLLVAAALAVGCSDSPGPGEPEPDALVVSAAASTFLTGDTVQLTVRTADGEALGASEVTWTSDDPGVVTVTPEGRVVGVGAGEARVRAARTLDGVAAEGETSLRVWLGRGLRVPGMASYDRLVPELMEAWGIPGGAVAVPAVCEPDSRPACPFRRGLRLPQPSRA
jgi:hypothetical protein